MQWFRFYTEALDDPKVQSLAPEDFRAWVNLLCLAARHGGILPDVASVAFALRIAESDAISVLDRLRIATLIDPVKGGRNGRRYAPHGWEKRQYKSDTSTERVKRFRKRSETVTVTPPETETDRVVPLAKANGAPAHSDKAFWANAKAYLGGESKGSLIGKWCKDYGREATARAITAAQLERAADPISFVSATLRGRGAALNGARRGVGI